MGLIRQFCSAVHQRLRDNDKAMPVYKIYRLKEAQQQQFRWAPHTIGPCVVRPRDYCEQGAVEAPTPYAAWFLLRDRGMPLRVGDLLECQTGELHICKYIGFEEARWQEQQSAAADEQAQGSPPRVSA